MRQLIQDMTDAEIVAEINKLTSKVMTTNQMFRYRSLTAAMHQRQRAGAAALREAI